jgi:L-lactate dehydrogenase (cytochrome)
MFTVPVSVDDYRKKAKKRLPGFLFDYIDGGSNAERTLVANSADFGRLHLKQRVMCDVGHIDTRTHLCGQPVSMPLALAPVGMAGMMARRGEVQGARAAHQLGIPFTASTVGICPVEEIKQASHSPFWFQLYMLRDRDLVLNLLERARLAGCETLVFTVDLAVMAMRYRDHRNAMGGKGMRASLTRLSQMVSCPHWIAHVGLAGRPHSIGNLSDVVDNPNSLDSFKAFIDSQFDPTANWNDIVWLRSVWHGKIIIKGVMCAEDAQRAVAAGADAVIVSNHGGRQLDGCASSISQLPSVVAAVGADVEVYMDGGIRSGIDVVKALALGARGVLIGRPWVWAIAAGQQAALVKLLELFQKEIAIAMALMGVNTIDELHPGLIEHA